MKEKFKNFTAKEMIDYIKHNKTENDDEWLEIEQWINEFLKSNPSEKDKKLFVPFGWAESVCMICDGIRRWRKSICFKCKRKSKNKKGCCEIYPQNKDMTGGIPTEVWTVENSECQYFESK